jgi:hypothetical protein
MAGAAAGGRGGTGGATPMAGSPGTGGTCAGNTYMPLKVGNVWTYEVTEFNVKSTKTQTVVRMEAVPATLPAGVPATLKGKMAFRVETKKNVNDLTVSWQAVEGMRAVRYAEQSYAAAPAGMMPTMVNLTEYWEPYKLRFDDSKATGAMMWTEMFKEGQVQPGVAAMPSTARTDVWAVISANEALATPAGMFNTVHIKKTAKIVGGAEANKEWWFARCVGKVKEVGGQTEILTKFTPGM